MGKLNVCGKARKTFECDTMIILLDFTSQNQNTAKAVETAASECDQLLEYLESHGIDIGDIHINNIDISRDSDDDGSTEVSANKKIELRLPFEMQFINDLSDIIKRFDFKIEMDVSFKLSNLFEVHNQLLKEAVLDSRKKAEMIAETMGQKVVGIEQLDAGSRYNHYDAEDREYFAKYIHKIGETHSISNKLKAPYCTEYENVEVVWIIE